jgi:hypothetical protein
MKLLRISYLLSINRYCYIFQMSFPTDLQSILVKLEFLAQVKEDEKINTKEMSFSPKNSWLSTFKRLYNKENRKLTLQYIQDTIRDASTLLDKYIDDKEYYAILLESFVSAKQGIENLQKTYRDSPDIISVLRVVIKDMNLRIENKPESS